jgi:predicted regulator of Ras-like GTPase activity (Roadblock/LC7/MglB family)
MALKGNLRDMSLSDIIQMTCKSRSQACLLVQFQHRQARLYFNGGQLVHAVLGSRAGKEVVYELLTWEDGGFEMEMDVSPPQRTITLSWSRLLLEGMHRIDESTAKRETKRNRAEAEAAQKTRDETLERMARDLKRITGIEEALICSREGQVLGQDTSDHPAREAAFSAFVGHRAETLGDLLNAGQFVQAVLAGQKQRVMIVTHKQNYVSLSLARRTSESVFQAIQMTLHRYR